MLRRLMGAAGILLAAAAAACGGGEPAAGPAAEAMPAATAIVAAAPTPASAGDALQHHLATKVLETGTQRVAFLLNTQKALVNAPRARISVKHQDGGTVPAGEVTGGV